MLALADGNSVFVAPEDFINLQESPAVFGSFDEFCKAAALAGLINKPYASYVTLELGPESFDGHLPILENRRVLITFQVCTPAEIVQYGGRKTG